MRKFFFMLLILWNLSKISYANEPIDRHVSIVGGGIIGALESYYAYQEAQKEGVRVGVTVYEKGESVAISDQAPTNTSYNIVPSLTIDEILSVVPRGAELVEKLAIPFDQPGGIRVDDVPGVNDSEAAMKFKEAVAIYGSDKDHDDRTLTLLMLGKKSMELWQQMYDNGDAELKAILEASNFNPCREPANLSGKILHDGYRIDLIYGIPNAQQKALKMQADYENLGYAHCALLSPEDVMAIDPYLTDFCLDHSELDAATNRVWRNDSAALWRPGGCIDTNAFLPKFYAYLKKIMGQYRDADGQLKDCFQLQHGSEVTAIEFDRHSEEARMIGLHFSNGACQIQNATGTDYRYVFCPGESVGTLQRLGFHEPVYAGFAGASLLIRIPLKEEQMKQYQQFSHCMEVHNEGIVLAWQARSKGSHLFLGVAGTKAFYGDKRPHKDEAFAKNRNLVQLNMLNQVLPNMISLACGYSTKGNSISDEELAALEAKGIAQRWVGRRAVAYDGFPTLGSLYYNDRQVKNARCTTHLGSGGVSFGPGAVFISRCSERTDNSPFEQKVLRYADSRRKAEQK